MGVVVKNLAVAICKGWGRAFAFLAVYCIARFIFGESMVKLEEKLNKLMFNENFFGPIYALFAMQPIINFKDEVLYESLGIFYIVFNLIIALIVVVIPFSIVKKIRRLFENKNRI